MARYSKVTQAASKKLKILVVHEISYVDKVIYEVHEFPEILSTRGHEVTFIDFAEGYKGRPGGNRRSWTQKGRVYKDARITIHSPWLSGLVAIDRLIALISVWPVLWRLRKQEFDVILNYAVPTYGIQVNLWAKARKIPVVHRALDVSHKIRQSIWNPAIELVEKLVFSMTSSISANNPAMAEYAAGISKKPLTRIAIHFPPTHNASWKLEPYSEKQADILGVRRTDLIIGYLGSFFYFSGLPEVLKSLALLCDQEESVKLLLVGGGEQEEVLRELVEKHGLEETVIFTGMVGFDDIPKYLSLFDVGINPMHPSDVSDFALPNKVIQYLAAGLPVVSTDLKGLKASLSDCAEVSWVKGPSDVINEALDVASKSSSERLKLRRPSLCVSKFDTNTASKSLEAFLRTQII